MASLGDRVVSVPGGLVRGFEEEGLLVFRGIPYARAPEGDLRWRVPEPPEPWTGVLDARSFGPIAPQNPPAPGMSIPGDPTQWSEDCLTLNVWTPGLDDARRPVMVWVHGGGFTSGSGASALYDGRHLAQAAGVVVVTINYRLGALGYLSHPALAPKDGMEWANFGLADQVAALRFVRESIGDFGGDPGNVTAFGESAGSMSLAVMLASPTAAELFDRVVLQSGPPVTMSASLAALRAERFSELAGAGRHVERGRLVDLDPRVLVEAANKLAAEALGEGALPLPFLPVVDARIIEEVPAHCIGSSGASGVPVLIGTTRDETAFFTFGSPAFQEMDQAALKRRVARLVGERARDLIDAYRSAREGRGEGTSAPELMTAITTDLVFRVPSVALASACSKAGAKCFTYLFTWESPFMGGVLGACHALDVPFVFGTIGNPMVSPFAGYGEGGGRLARAMMKAWSSFARCGDPSCEELGQWPAFESTRRETMLLGPSVGVEADPRGAELSAWDDLGIAPGPGHHIDLPG